jgi:anti-anti-sigma factor
VIAIDFEVVRGREEEFKEALLPRVKRQTIVVDLSNVPRIDAAGIAALIDIYCSSIEAGTGFSVTSPSSHVLETLRVVGLDSLLIYRSQPDRFRDYSPEATEESTRIPKPLTSYVPTSIQLESVEESSAA